MKKTVRFAAIAALLITAAILFLPGCSGKENNPGVETKGETQVAASGGNSSQPVNQPAKNDNPPVKPPLPVPKAEVGVPAAEAKTTENKGKVAYLTFDDGPNSHYTGRILDILSQKKARATFMVVGQNVVINPSVMQRIKDEGHGIANHTFSHDYNKIYSTPDAFIADLEENNNVLAPYTGKPVKVFRAPGGPQKLGPALKEKLRTGGYTSVSWNISSADSDPRGVTRDQVYQNIVSGLENVENMKLTPIVLMHDGTQLTTTAAKPGTAHAAYVQSREAVVEALPAIIDHFRSKGYTFGVVDEKTPPAW
ncbi:MAG: polysaccharide deacetylase family protein [Bacillota bacterium]